MKSEFENSIRRLGFFVPSTGHQNCFDKSLKVDIATEGKVEVVLVVVEEQVNLIERSAKYRLEKSI